VGEQGSELVSGQGSTISQIKIRAHHLLANHVDGELECELELAAVRSTRLVDRFVAFWRGVHKRLDKSDVEAEHIDADERKHVHLGCEVPEVGILCLVILKLCQQHRYLVVPAVVWWW
jgi:hypothetical protein